MTLKEYITTMDLSVVLFIFGSLLTIIGFLINNSIRDLKDKFEEIKVFHTMYEEKLAKQEERRIELEKEISEKRHDLINETITPLIFRIMKIEQKINEIGE